MWRQINNLKNKKSQTMKALQSYKLILLLLFFTACKQTKVKRINEDHIQYICEEKLTNVIVHDINSPPVAARMYAYSNLAFYEALRPAYPEAISCLPQLKGFDTLVADNDKSAQVNYSYAAALAFMNVAEALVFSKDSIRAVRDSLKLQYEFLDKLVTEQSLSWANQVSAVILKRASQDGYKITRGMPKFSVLDRKSVV